MRLLQHSVRHYIGIAGLAVTTLIWAGCVSTPPAPPPPPPSPNASNISLIPLQIGDSLTVYLTGTPGQAIPPSEFVLSGAGHINLPLLDTNIPAIGKSPHELEQIIHDLYVPKYFTTISVTVTPGPRFFYVSGAINGAGVGGKQLYTGYVTVLRAIATAGGFNDYAAQRRVQLTRQDGKIYYINCKKALKDPSLDLEVLPGDKIYVDIKTFWETMFGR
jgi:protein involved in polysaccharide export with SLBB domain